MQTGTDYFPNWAEVAVLLREQKLEAAEGIFSKLMEQIRLQQAQLEALLDTVNEAICMIDAEHRVVAWNHRAELLYGIKRNEILQQPIDRYFSNLRISEVMNNGQEVSNFTFDCLPCINSFA